jgi:hypothetical protein
LADVHVQIVVDPDSTGNLGKALAELKEHDPDFLWPSAPWWHKPPDNARGVVARALSKHGCKGKLSVEPHAGEGHPWDAAPEPRWTGFSPSKSRFR